MLKKLIRYTHQHTIIAAIIVLGIGGGGYYLYTKLRASTSETRYVLATVQKGTIIVSVSGSGQVAVSNQVDIKARASGDVVLVSTKKGDEVKAGTLLVQLDARDGQKAVRDAVANLDTAKLSLVKLKQPADQLTLLQTEHALTAAKEARVKAGDDLITARASLEKLKQPADALSILQAENTLAQAQESKKKAEDDLSKAYDDGFNTVANAFLDLPTVVSGMNDIFFESTIERNNWNISWYTNQASSSAYEKTQQYAGDVTTSYNTAKLHYTDSFDQYKTSSRTSSTAVLEALIVETYDTTKLLADAVKSGNNLIDYVQSDLNNRDTTVPTIFVTHKNLLNTYTSKTNSNLLSLLSIKRTIETSKEGIVNADRNIAEKTESLAKLRAGTDPLDIQAQEFSLKQRIDAVAGADRSVAEKTESLAKLKAGTDPLDIRTQELLVQERENTLFDVRSKLGDYWIRAPFDGVVAKIDLKKGDSIASGSVVVTFVTKQRMAQISLNEVDAAKIKVGQKTTLTFDAVPELGITGVVTDIDALGTVTQGVVTYAVQISFDTQDERVKPGMSLSAAIITDMRQDVLVIPSSAVKTQGSLSFVSVFTPPLQGGQGNQGVVSLTSPQQQVIEIGLSNDTQVEIMSGIGEGDQIVARTITTQATASTSTAPSLFGAAGARGAGGGGGTAAGGGARIRGN